MNEDRAKYLFKNLGILTISNFASKILVFLLVPLYTSVLSTVEYGSYDLVVTTISMLFPLLTVNIAEAVMRFSMDKECSKNEIAQIGFKYVAISISIFAFLLLLCQAIPVIKFMDGLYNYIFFYFVSYVLNQFFIQFSKGLERVSAMGIAGVLGTTVMIAANIIFLLVFKMGLNGFFLANILAQAIPVFYFFVKLKFWRFLTPIYSNAKLEKKMIIYCAPLLFTALGWWVNSAADRYIVTFFCGVAANGLLSVSYKIPSIINVFQGIFIQAWQISAIKEYGGEKVAIFYGRTFNYINVLMSAACAWLIFLAKPLATILYAKDFYVAWQYVPFLLISSVLNCASGFIGPILSAKKDSKSMALSSIYGSIINIILNILLVYLIGIQGATIATVISSFVIYYFRKKAVNEEFIVKGYWKVIMTWFLLCLQAVIEIYTAFWYIELVIMLILLGINWSILCEATRSLFKKQKNR